MYGSGASASGGSNRTLLELKYVVCGIIPKPCQFQSYLTGIEIKERAVKNRICGSSNRTLLELKSPEGIKELAKSMFQSYLTGIEISISISGRFAGTCSNRTLLELKFIHESIRGHFRLVPIVPYWN